MHTSTPPIQGNEATKIKKLKAQEKKHGRKPLADLAFHHVKKAKNLLYVVLAILLVLGIILVKFPQVATFLAVFIFVIMPIVVSLVWFAFSE